MSMNRADEQRRAHRLADDYQAIADAARGKNYARWQRATHQAKAWREFAYCLSLLPEAA